MSDDAKIEKYLTRMRKVLYDVKVKRTTGLINFGIHLNEGGITRVTVASGPDNLD